MAGNYIFVIPILSPVRKYTLAAIIFFLVAIAAESQNHKRDSLVEALAHTTQDTERVNVLIRMAATYENTVMDSALLLCNQALILARHIGWKKGIANAQYGVGIYTDLKGNAQLGLAYEDSAMNLAVANDFKVKLGSIYNVMGNILSEQSQYTKALDYYFKAVAIDSLNNKKGSLPDIYNNIGLVYADQSNYVKAEEFYFKAMKMYDETNNKDGIATTSSNLGNIYDLQGNYKKALKNYLNALEIDKEIDKEDAIAMDYSNLGNGYMSEHDYSKAIDYTYQSIMVSRKVGTLGNLSNSLGNIGLIFTEVYAYDSSHSNFTYKEYGKEVSITYSSLLDSALAYLQSAGSLAKETDNYLSLVYALKGLGSVFSIQKKYDKSIASYQQALVIEDSLGLLREQMETSQALAHTLMQNGNYQLATKYFDRVLVLKDSIFSREKEKQSGKLEAGFEYDKKLLEQRKEHEKEQALGAERDKHEKIIIGVVTVGLIVVLVFLILLFKRFKVTNEQKKVIEEQKKEVDGAYGKLNNAHLELQEKDKDITDSIAYARKIQSAILPSEEDLKQSLGEYFVLYKPRDVVSGDFYWCYNEGNKVIFAVVDCTGHGVPGAFMSMIGNSLLNQVVIESHINNAAEILNSVRGNLIKQLQQRGEAVSRDGMDMAVCIWDKGNNMLEYAGANNALYLVRSGINTNITGTNKLRPHGGSLLEVLPDKQPIGYQEGKMESLFTAYSIQLQKGDCIFIASDGYHDQFGGERNKKFTSRAFRDLLASLTNKSVTEQKEILNTTIEKWKRDYAQTDDICVLGVRIS